MMEKLVDVNGYNDTTAPAILAFFAAVEFCFCNFFRKNIYYGLKTKYIDVIF